MKSDPDHVNYAFDIKDVKEDWQPDFDAMTEKEAFVENDNKKLYLFSLLYTQKTTQGIQS